MNVSNSSPSALHPYFVKTIRPSRRRYIVYRLLVTVAAYQLGFALLRPFFTSELGSPQPLQAWILFSLLYAAVYTVSLYFATRTFVEDVSIKITNGMLEGPTGTRRERTSFPLEKIDRARSLRVSWLNHLLQYRHIWSVDGKRILLLAHSFNGTQLQALFQKLGFED